MARHSSSKVYVWVGRNRQGTQVSGQIKAQSAVAVRVMLRKQGITPTQVRRQRRVSWQRNQAIRPLDIAVFTRQMATMLKAGVPLLQSLDIIAEGIEKPALRALLDELKIGIAAGNRLASTLRQHPAYFDELYCNLVAVGEQTGALELLLERIATYKEKTEHLKAKIKKALRYPFAVMAVAVLVSWVLLVKVVPQFEEIFISFDAQLPLFTLGVIALSEYLQNHAGVLLGFIALVGLGVQRLWRSSTRLRSCWERFVLRLPVVGNIAYHAAVARFARTLATTFAAGVPLLDALESVTGSVANVVFREAVQQVKRDVANGMQLHFAMRNTAVFPVMAVQLTAIGEESGSLDAMLDKVAVYYEQQVEQAVDGLTALMEPLILSVLGVLVGGLIIAMYLPIFELGAVF
ncbi:type II secretion system F family protein [Denitrificimonas sp. JX-1]|uniref:Type II secretion system F family protein n=1 Tax=Denitrificimonas halotolerans TaxID=3098930 RepID=A0ABU5GRN0_9GAMM|nr:type II secretion system F family protein [Denitrificimonas sp. JX-1]MDY7219650.1 type II secretion system F family protein [Denitrificimonas sp. JX-1]